MQRNNNNAPILFVDIWLSVKLFVYGLRNVSYVKYIQLQLIEIFLEGRYVIYKKHI